MSEIDRSELIKAIQLVMPGVAKDSSLLTGMDTLVFSPDLLQTYNASLSVSYPISLGVSGVVKAAEVAKIVPKMAGILLKLESDGQSLLISDGATELKMALMESPVVDLAAALDLENLEWSNLPKDFLQGLALCLGSVSKTPSHGPLTGVRVEGAEMLSTDNFRATFFEMEAAMAAFTIPGNGAAELLKVPGLESFAAAGSWVHFQNQYGAIFSAKVFATEYPSAAVRGLFPGELREESHTIPEGLDKALERASVLSYASDSGGSYVGLRREGGSLVCKGEREFGSIREKIPATDAEWPEGVAINIQPGYLLAILSKTRKFQISAGRVYLHGEGFGHIIATIAED